MGPSLAKKWYRMGSEQRPSAAATNPGKQAETVVNFAAGLNTCSTSGPENPVRAAGLRGPAGRQRQRLFQGKNSISLKMLIFTVFCFIMVGNCCPQSAFCFFTVHR